MQARRIFISPAHSFYGRHGKGSVPAPMVEVAEAECIAGRGICGDRFFDYKPDYKGQITFFSWEVLNDLWAALGIPPELHNPAATRRNVLTTGLDLNTLIGRDFEIDGIQFLGTEECRPCYWMNEAIHHEAEAWMRGRGGLRAKILTDGLLRATHPTTAVTP
ncbi:MAG: molybdenum cofactor biosysynthesis protein [Puniceicoccaceae bacterium]|nr:MAG: molybdenum cofactor biosysynthesis protein [Puniceicoccaceae bacterium]